MGRIVVSTGGKAVDIDAYACVIAYSELLSLQNINFTNYIGTLNHSVTSEVREFKTTYKTKYEPLANDVFILMDFSDWHLVPSFIKDFSKIEDIFDHHPGFEQYWLDKLGKQTHIEKVGACATLIWEEFKKSGYENKISAISANLIYTAVVSNTLNFKSSVTTDRDIAAFNELKRDIKLPVNWIESYFKEQEVSIFLDPEDVVKGDTRIVEYPNISFKLIIGQLELWDSRELINNNLAAVKKGLGSFDEQHWFLTSPSISEGKNYLYCEDVDTQNLIKRILPVNFENNLAVTDKLYLRKELLKMFQALE